MANVARGEDLSQSGIWSGRSDPGSRWQYGQVATSKSADGQALLTPTKRWRSSMRKIFPSLVLRLVVLTFLLDEALLCAQEYLRYCNERYGFCVNYPSHLTMDPPPTNGDGRRWHDRNGLVITASGINNILDETLQSALYSQSKEFDKITYRRKGKNWF